MSTYENMSTDKVVEEYNELKKNLHDCKKELSDRANVFKNYFSEGKYLKDYLTNPICPTLEDIKNYLLYTEYVNPDEYMSFTKGGYIHQEDGLYSTFHMQELAVFMKHAYEYLTGKEYKIVTSLEDTSLGFNNVMPILNYKITEKEDSKKSKDLIIPQKAVSLSKEDRSGFASVSIPFDYGEFKFAKFMARENIVKIYDEISLDEFNKVTDLFHLDINHDGTFVTDTLFRLIRYRVLNHHGADFDDEDYDHLTYTLFGQSYPIKEEVKDAFGKYSFERKLTK